MLNTNFTALPCTSPIITQNLECNSYGCHSQTISLIFLHALSLVFISVSLSRACLRLPRPSPCLGRVCTSPAPPRLPASSPSRGGRVWHTWQPPRPAGAPDLGLAHRANCRIKTDTQDGCQNFRFNDLRMWDLSAAGGGGDPPPPALLTHRLGETRVCIALCTS